MSHEHDIMHDFGSDGVMCACGRMFSSRTKHGEHFQVERARSALKGEDDD